MAVITVLLGVELHRPGWRSQRPECHHEQSPSGVDNVRDFGDTKMALLGSSLGAVFAGLTWDIRRAWDLVMVDFRWPDHRRAFHPSHTC